MSSEHHSEVTVPWPFRRVSTDKRLEGVGWGPVNALTRVERAGEKGMGAVAMDASGSRFMGAALLSPPHHHPQKSRKKEDDHDEAKEAI